MKTLSCCFLALATAAACGQDDVVEYAEPMVEFVPAVVYEAPVIYQAPVLYQAPVVYLAPVYYLTTAAPPPMEYAAPAPAPCPAPSTVFYIGRHGGSYSYAHCGSSGSTVFHLGRQQACGYGYQFNRQR